MDLRLPEIVVPNGIYDEEESSKGPEIHETKLQVMPLGKAVHTLLHVKEEAFQHAINKPTRDSPIARALYSIDEYLETPRFEDIYDPLKDQFLKPKSTQAKAALRLAQYVLLHSRHKANFRSFLKTHELQSGDKRAHLAAALLLESVAVDEFIPDLVRLAQQYGEKPTMTACIACDAVLACSRQALQPKKSNKENTGLMIQVIEEHEDDWNGIEETWEYIQDIFSVMRKWYPFDPIATSAWNELQIFTACAKRAISNRNLYKRINKAWSSISALLISKNIVSKKPLAVKKQLACLQEESDPLVRYLNIICVALLQKSQWIVNGGDRLLSLEERDIKERIYASLVDMMEQSLPCPFETCGKTLISQTIVHAPHLVNTEHVPSTVSKKVIEAALKGDIALDKLPHSVVFSSEAVQVLVSAVGNSNVKAGDMLNDLVTELERDSSKDAFNISCPIVDELLKFVATNDLACKVLIRFMDIAALIAKALMAKTWSNGDGVLVFVGMIRYFKSTKRFPEVNSHKKSLTSPADIVATSSSPVEGTNDPTLSDDEVQRFAAEVLSVLQLWVMKATDEAVQNGLGQLVYSSYSAPNDGTFIDAWKNISHGIGNNHPEAIWTVIIRCLHIMKDQTKLTDELFENETEESEREVYTIIVKRLSPLLILRTFHQQAYESVTLPKVVQEGVDWSTLDFKSEKVKWSSDNGSEHLDLMYGIQRNIKKIEH
ncbi:hypothetical protein BDB00DRAFT_873642 [Zychaea mexicana]|uniref:uncharacterized protein n=1 Tax=Zychaea mexicana TaxID=64656 RepID=UPI0022FDFBA1|nr:uncharacterized protein BDB00DRAFT_873642 [Zychaea mexicana]KAI9492190.1 hypothetical protein BDB00DRAFT_873642 [Zychaea mexicana]